MRWVLIVLLLLFWLFGVPVANLGAVVYLVLAEAVILVVYNLLTRGTATR